MAMEKYQNALKLECALPQLLLAGTFKGIGWLNIWYH